jgi:hypothetical protein
MSGGQTGADQAGWRAARASGIAIGGWMPEGFLTEAGPRPDFGEMFGAVEMPGGGYPERTRVNVRDSGETVWFGDTKNPGRQTTLGASADLGNLVDLEFEGLTRPSNLVAWV